MKTNEPDSPESGVTDVRRVRESIAREHEGDLAGHVAESNRIAESVREKLRLGRTIQPPSRPGQKAGAGG